MAANSDSSGLVVIGAGFMRTGTNSLQLALQRLLGGKCYHMKEVVQDPILHCNFWYHAAEQPPSQQEWRRFFSDYKAAVDLPTIAFYKELMEVFPDAKVVLTVREPRRWFKSLTDTVFKSHKMMQTFPVNVLTALGPMRHFLPMSTRVMEKLFGFDVQSCMDDEARMVAAYHRHVEEVKRHVPSDRLLVFEIKDGWEPLCNFLDLPMPRHAFPHVNTTDDFQKAVNGMVKKRAMQLGAMLALVGAIIGYAAYHKDWAIKMVSLS